MRTASATPTTPTRAEKLTTSSLNSYEQWRHAWRYANGKADSRITYCALNYS